MVIEPLSLIFFRVPSCAAAGTTTARVRAARISVIGRVMSVFSLWAVRAGGWMGGEGCTILREQVPTAQRQTAPGGLEFGVFLQKERDMRQVATRIEHDLLGDRAVPAD